MGGAPLTDKKPPKLLRVSDPVRANYVEFWRDKENRMSQGGGVPSMPPWLSDPDECSWPARAILTMQTFLALQRSPSGKDKGRTVSAKMLKKRWGWHYYECEAEIARLVGAGVLVDIGKGKRGVTLYEVTPPDIWPRHLEQIECHPKRKSYSGYTRNPKQNDSSGYTRNPNAENSGDIRNPKRSIGVTGVTPNDPPLKKKGGKGEDPPLLLLSHDKALDVIYPDKHEWPQVTDTVRKQVAHIVRVARNVGTLRLALAMDKKEYERKGRAFNFDYFVKDISNYVRTIPEAKKNPAPVKEIDPDDEFFKNTSF